MRAWTLGLLMAAGLAMAVAVDAKPRDVVIAEAHVQPGADLNQVLAANGWTVLGLPSNIYQPGMLFGPGSSTSEGTCVDATPITGALPSIETQGSKGFFVEGGGGVGAISGSGEVQATSFKLKSTTDVEQAVIPGMQMELNDKCLRHLHSLKARGTSLEGWFVIQETARARVKEIKCTSKEAAAKVRAMWLARGEIGAMSECIESSEVTGVIAYKARAVNDLMPVSGGAFPQPAVNDIDVKISRLQTCKTNHKMEQVSEIERKTVSTEYGEYEKITRFRYCEWPAPSFADPDGYYEIRYRNEKGPGDSEATGTNDADRLRAPCDKLQLWYDFGSQGAYSHYEPFFANVGSVVGIGGDEYDGSQGNLPFYPDRDELVVLRNGKKIIAKAECEARILKSNVEPAPQEMEPPPSMLGSSSTFAVEFISADPTISKLKVICHKGGVGEGANVVHFAHAGKGPCSVYGYRGEEKISVFVTLSRPTTYRCFYGGVRVCEPAPQGYTGSVLKDSVKIEEMVGRVLNGGKKQIEQCYSQALKTNEGLKGAWYVDFGISRDGEPVMVNVGALGSSHAGIESCIQKAVGRWRFERIAEPVNVARTYRFGS